MTQRQQPTTPYAYHRRSTCYWKVTKSETEFQSELPTMTTEEDLLQDHYRELALRRMSSVPAFVLQGGEGGETGVMQGQVLKVKKVTRPQTSDGVRARPAKLEKGVRRRHSQCFEEQSLKSPNSSNIPSVPSSVASTSSSRPPSTHMHNPTSSEKIRGTSKPLGKAIRSLVRRIPFPRL